MFSHFRKVCFQSALTHFIVILYITYNFDNMHFVFQCDCHFCSNYTVQNNTKCQKVKGIHPSMTQSTQILFPFKRFWGEKVGLNKKAGCIHIYVHFVLRKYIPSFPLTGISAREDTKYVVPVLHESGFNS